MQTKKKSTGRSSRELASPRISRQQKKLVENVQVQGKKVTELITSSARKKKVASQYPKALTFSDDSFGAFIVTCLLMQLTLFGFANGLIYLERLLQLSVSTLSKTIEEPVGGTNLDTKFRLVDDDSNACLGYHAEHEFSNSFIIKDNDNGAANCVSDTIFSPSFHIARSVGGEISTEDFCKFFQHDNQQIQDCGKENIQIDCPGGHVLSPEVSAIYLSMKNSNLECIDENNQDHMSVDVCQEDEDAEEYDDFDPYYFIKNLPELSSVVPAFRPVLLPKQTRSCPSTTLVLDLDDFLERVSRLFEIIIFTASQSIYAEQLLNVLDPRRKIFRHRVYRDSCVFVDGNYLKDLSVLGRDLAHVIIIDNSPQAFGFQVDNGIPIESWFEDRSDTELLLLLPFLESLVGVQDRQSVVITIWWYVSLILCASADLPSIQVIKDSLQEFAAPSGLQVNPNKSQIILSRVGQQGKQQILDLLGFQEGFLPVKYLGVPLISSRLTMADCKPLIDKLDSRIAGWNHLNLTYAGRAQLMKSVLSSLHSYWALVFILPKGVIKILEAKMRKFLWKGSTGRGYAKVAWEQVCRPKEEGGLGFCNILVMNQALMLKHLWKLIQNDRNSIWADWIIKHRLHKKTLWTFHGLTGSWGWKKMIKLRPFFQRGLQYKVGDGLYFQLWQDIWHERGPLCVSYPQGPNVTGLPIDTLLSRVMRHGQWNWPTSTDPDFNELATQLPPIYANRPDQIVWRTRSGRFSTQSHVVYFSLIEPRWNGIHSFTAGIKFQNIPSFYGLLY
ncbi:UNVERIFIED_CONTAM: CTD small phosphatase-like protein 2 [Sesamum radiatum]|uniref:CTD small phosphatase-like protein 2 n=1 Tax=Sesamum radiatum TaxID=300843 RepID=A0AAW2MXZ7_SESRA